MQEILSRWKFYNEFCTVYNGKKFREFILLESISFVSEFIQNIFFLYPNDYCKNTCNNETCFIVQFIQSPTELFYLDRNNEQCTMPSRNTARVFWRLHHVHCTGLQFLADGWMHDTEVCCLIWIIQFLYGVPPFKVALLPTIQQRKTIFMMTLWVLNFKLEAIREKWNLI